MDPMLNRAELLRELDRSYSRFIAEIEKLKDDQLAIVGVTKLWSVRDLLAHMSGRQTLLKFKASYARIVRLARTITDEQLADRDLMESFLGDTYGHYDEHFASVLKFAAQQAK